MKDVELPWFVGPQAIEAYLNPRQYVVVDYESTNINKGSALEPDNEIVLACWYVVTPQGVVAKHHWGNQYDQSELEKDVKESQFVVAHNAKFELQWLKRSGLELRDILVYDTMLGEWVRGGNRFKLQHLSLEEVGQRYGYGSKEEIAGYLIKKGVCPSDIPREWLLPYCYRDVELTYLVFQEQVEALHKEELLHLALTRNLCCAALADMEFNPSQLDAYEVKKVYDEYVTEFQELERQLAVLTGGINMSSNKQLIEFLYGKLNFSPPINPRTKEPFKTPKGDLQVTVDVLAKLESQTSEQDKFLQLYVRRNKLSALLSKNLEFFMAIVEEKGGEFFGRFNQATTDTGRLSASGFQVLLKRFGEPKAPQLQNLPREFKYLFTAHDEDWVVVETDGSQLEFRVAADLGNDDIAYDEICNGVDIHAVTADVLTNAGEPTTRQEAKSRTFTPLFGGGGQTKAEKDYVQFFRLKYEGITATQRQWALTTASKGWFTTPYGMRFYFPGTAMQPSGYITNSTSIFNYPIQGFATGEIIPIAMVCLWHRTRGKPVVTFNSVHDSIASRVHASYVEEYEAVAKQSFTYDVYKFLDDVYDYQFKVPLGVGIKVAKNWSATKNETSINVWPDGRETRSVK